MTCLTLLLLWTIHVHETFFLLTISLVTLNYRLGTFGFLSFGNDLVSGNMGLRDQIEALKWVNKNIHHFGGDPARVTIFGESAGGISVHALQLSPAAKGLFSGAIAQSGTMLMVKELDPEVSKDWRTSRALAETVNCSSLEYDSEMLSCLQDIDALDLLLKSQKPLIWSPTEANSDWADPWIRVDSYASDPVMPLNPLDAMKTGDFNPVPLMIGKCSVDILLYLSQDIYPSL